MIFALILIVALSQTTYSSMERSSRLISYRARTMVTFTYRKEAKFKCSIPGTNIMGHSTQYPYNSYVKVYIAELDDDTDTSHNQICTLEVMAPL